MGCPSEHGRACNTNRNAFGGSTMKKEHCRKWILGLVFVCAAPVERRGAQSRPPAEPKKEEQKEPVIPDILKWASKLSWYGDFRYRYEYIDDDSGATEDRHRNRIRARLGLTAKINDEWDLGFRIATRQGEVSGDPVSTNQTFDPAFSKKPIWLDP